MTMAFFPVSGATGDNMNEIKNVLTAANAITTLYYQSTSVLVFLSPYSNKVIRFDTDRDFRITIGDAWTSGTTITNAITIGYPYSNTFSSTAAHAIITTADTLVFAIAGGTDSVVYIFSKFTNTNFMACCTAASSAIPASYVMRAYNTTTMEQLLPAFYPYLMTSDTSYYHQYNPVWRTFLNSYYRDFQFTSSLRVLMRNANLGVGKVFEIAGNDVIVPFEWFKDDSTYDQNTCMIIVGGNL